MTPNKQMTTDETLIWREIEKQRSDAYWRGFGRGLLIGLVISLLAAVLYV